MSANLTNSATLSRDALFIGRVRSAMTEKAIDLINNAGNGAMDRVRKNLAGRVINDPDAYVRFFVHVVADDDIVSANSDPAAVTDDSIRTVVSAAWDPVAVKDL